MADPCPGRHIDPKEWKRSTRAGIIRWVCKHCGKLIGYDAQQAGENQTRKK
jgi:hypothetical protein